MGTHVYSGTKGYKWAVLPMEINSVATFSVVLFCHSSMLIWGTFRATTDLKSTGYNPVNNSTNLKYWVRYVRPIVSCNIHKVKSDL